MICQNCGKLLLEDSVYCGNCGAKAAPEIPLAPVERYQTEAAVYAGEAQAGTAYAVSQSGRSLMMGILSIVFCWVLGIPGILMGLRAVSRGQYARRILTESYYEYYQALAGIITGGIGLGLSVMFAFVYLCGIFFAVKL